MTSDVSPQQLADINNRSITQVIYGLYAASLISGVTLLIGVILNYVKRDDVVNTMYESHFRWQMRTFWGWFLWIVVGAITLKVIIGFVIMGATLVWFIYRIAKGWLRLIEGKPMYAD